MKSSRVVYAYVNCEQCDFQRDGASVRIVKDAGRFHAKHHGHALHGAVDEQFRIEAAKEGTQ